MAVNARVDVDSKLVLTAIAGALGLGQVPRPATASGGDEEMPASIDVTGVVRDFRERTEEGGHPDMEKRPDRGFGRYSGNISDTIGEDRKPVWTGNGRKVNSQWRDSEHRQICHILYDPAREDVEGSWGSPVRAVLRQPRRSPCGSTTTPRSTCREP